MPRNQMTILTQTDIALSCWVIGLLILALFVHEPSLVMAADPLSHDDVQQGHAYYFGDTGVVDKAKAAQHYHKAAEKGDSDAKYFLAVCLKNSGLKNNDGGVESLLVELAESNHACAQFALFNNSSLTIEQQFNYLQAAASTGHAMAQNALAFWYSRPEAMSKDFVIDKNEKLARQLSLDAAKSGTPSAMLSCARAIDNPEESLAWYREAANARYYGSDPMIEKFGRSYYFAYGGRENYFRKSGRTAESSAQKALAEAYLRGEGVPKNLYIALRYYQEAEGDDGWSVLRTGEKSHEVEMMIAAEQFKTSDYEMYELMLSELARHMALATLEYERANGSKGNSGRAEREYEKAVARMQKALRKADPFMEGPTTKAYSTTAITSMECPECDAVVKILASELVALQAREATLEKSGGRYGNVSLRRQLFESCIALTNYLIDTMECTHFQKSEFRIVGADDTLRPNRICPVCKKMIARAGVYTLSKEQYHNATRIGLRKSEYASEREGVHPLEGGSIEELSKYEYTSERLIFPVQQGRVVSPMGPRIINGKYSYHGGVDIGKSADGTPIDKAAIYAPFDGTIVLVKQDNPNDTGRMGNTVAFEGATPVEGRQLGFRFLHMDRVAAGIKNGKEIKRGDLIGYVGGTGDQSRFTPHLHFDVFQNGILDKNGNFIHSNKINPGLIFNNLNAHIPDFCTCEFQCRF